MATLWVTGLDEAKVLDLCRNAATGANEVCEISGYLHKSSFTVGGTRSAVEAFKSMAKDAKAFQLEYLQAKHFPPPQTLRCSHSDQQGTAAHLRWSMEGRVQELLLPRDPSHMDLAAEDDVRLNAIVGDATEPSDGRTTPRLGLSEGSPQDAGAVQSDDSALASLMGAPKAAALSHLTERTRSAGVLASLGDDLKLTNLIGPSQAEKDDLALVGPAWLDCSPVRGKRLRLVAPIRGVHERSPHYYDLSSHAVGFLTSIEVPRTRQPYALSATLSACAGAGAWQVALALMQEFSADVMCYNSLISACGKGMGSSLAGGGQWILAMAVLHEMMLIRLPPSNATFSAAISACEKAFRWQEALALLQQALGLLRPELSCLNAMLSACEKGQRWDLALHLLKEMPSRRLVPDRISFNAVLSACAASSIWTMALHLFNVMPSKRLHPGQITRNAAFCLRNLEKLWKLKVVITACEKALQWQIVLELLHADGLTDLPGSGSLHHAAWLVSLLRSLSSMLVADHALFSAAAQQLVHVEESSMQSKEFANLAWAFASTETSSGFAARRPRCVSNSAKGSGPEELVNLRKRELLEIVRGYEISTDGMTKQELIDAIHKLQKESEKPQSTETSEIVMPDPGITQRGVAEIAMEEWQKASTVGFDCKSGRRVEDGVDLDILGPDGQVQHTVSFRHTWPPSCTCDDAQRWGSQRRCKHVCMILVKCGVPYAAVADSNWKPDELEVLLSDGATIDDPAAQDYAEGMLGVVWSLKYAQELSQSFLDFATSTLCVLTETKWKDVAAPSCMPSSRSMYQEDDPRVLLETSDTLVLQKPAGWQVDDGSTSMAENVRSLSSFVSQMLPLRRCPLLGDGAFSRGFLHRLDVPTSGLILVAKTMRKFFELRLQLASGLLQREPCLSTKGCVMVRWHQHDMKCERQCIGGQMVAVPAVPSDGLGGHPSPLIKQLQQKVHGITKH
eukprot:symbB.v1.2.002858.t1/scaffold130.1/size334612/9